MKKMNQITEKKNKKKMKITINHKIKLIIKH